MARYTLEETVTKFYGERGTEKREQFEANLKQDMLIHQLKSAGKDKIIFSVDTEFESESQIKGVDGKPLYMDIAHNVHGLKRTYGTVLQVPQYTPDAPVFQDGRNGRIVKMRDMQPEVQVGDKIYFDFNAIGDSRRLAPGIFWILYREVIAKELKPLVLDIEAVPSRDYSKEEITAFMRETGIFLFKSKEELPLANIYPIGTHVLLKPVYKPTVQEIDPVNQPGVMGEVSASGLITTTDQHLKGAGEIGAYKLVQDENQPIFDADEQPILPEKLLINELYEKNQATVAHIGRNIKHREPVAKVGDKVLVSLFTPNAEGLYMPNVPTIKINGQEYFYTRQHEIEGVYYECGVNNANL